MNTINIFLKTSGSLAQLDYDFRLFKGSYQNKLIDIYVPKSLLYNNEQNTFLNAVKTGGLLTAENGTTITTSAYYASFIGEKVVDGVQYAIFEQQMPKEYTIYSGTQTIVVNVVNIDNTDSENPIIIDVITSQTVELTVLESAYVSTEDVEDPTELEILFGLMDAKQDKVDSDINVTGTVTSDSVVGAINDLNTQVNTNTSNIGTNESSIESLDSRVSSLEDAFVGNETPIGTMQTTSLPTDEQLDAFVLVNAGRQPEENDVIIVEVTAGGALTTYKYYYTDTNGWAHYQITSLSRATNSVYGIMKGSYGEEGYTQSISANIQNGQIIALYYRDNNEYTSVALKLSNLDTSVANIISGAQVVGEAVQAQKDSQGNDISTTYAKASDVYTKQQSDNLYLSKNYMNVYYYSADGFVDEVPTTPATGIQFSANVPTTGEVELATVERQLEGDYTFNSNSTDQSTIWFQTDANCVIQFRVLTYVEKNNISTLISSQVSEELAFENGVPRSIPINAIYSLLGTSSIDLDAGDVFRKVIYVTSADNVAVTCDLISSAQYPSSFNLTTTALTIDVNAINSMKEIYIHQADWTDNQDGTYSIEVTQLQHEQAPSSKYLLTLQEEVSAGTYQNIAFTPIIDEDGNITITSFTAIDCRLLVASGTTEKAREILSLTNPQTMPTINYEQIGAIKITQTQTATALTLPAPSNPGQFYTVMVANSGQSTESINVEGQTIVVGNGLQFKWVGEWVTGQSSSTITTSDVYDAVNQQTLTQTLGGLESEINDRVSEVSTANVLYGTDSNGDQTTHSISDIRSITEYTTTAPTQANTDGLKVAVLSSDPATKYSGWIYLIEESQSAQGGNSGGLL